MGKETKIISSLKQVREDIGMTQQELAIRIGVRRETISHLENNRYNPSLEMALKIVKIFDMKIEDIFQLRKED
ncbi:TPA: helix-turn-helix transcriptional regulator [Streptococcus agalactiae]